MKDKEKLVLKIKGIKEPDGVNIPEGKLRVILDDNREAVIEVYIMNVPSDDTKKISKKIDKTLGGFVGSLKDHKAFSEGAVEYQKRIRGDY